MSTFKYLRAFRKSEKQLIPMKKIIIILLSFVLYSCNNREETENKKELKKVYTIPNIPILSKDNINEVFTKKLLYGNNIIDVKPINESTRFLIAGYKQNAYNLYFKRNTPVMAGEYKNSGLFIIYDFIYVDEKQNKVAWDNLKKELAKLNIYNNNEYFDYFKGSGFVYSLDGRNKKITIVSFSVVSGHNEYNIIKKFYTKNKEKFDEIIFAFSTGSDIIK